jgi:hypothetical protein
MSHVHCATLSLREQQALKVLATIDAPLDLAQLACACAPRARPDERTMRRLVRSGLVAAQGDSPTRYAAAPEWWLRMPTADRVPRRPGWRHSLGDLVTIALIALDHLKQLA